MQEGEVGSDLEVLTELLAKNQSICNWKAGK